MVQRSGGELLLAWEVWCGSGVVSRAVFCLLGADWL